MRGRSLLSLPLCLACATSAGPRADAGWSIQAAGDWSPASDSAFDIGAPGRRPREGLFATSIGIGTTAPEGGLHLLNTGATPDRTSIALDTTKVDFRRRAVRFLTDGVLRFSLDTDVAPEFGGNEGSYFGLNAYSDTGRFLRNVFTVHRSDGAVLWLNPTNDPTARMGIGTRNPARDSKLTVRSQSGSAIRAQSETADAGGAHDALVVQAISRTKLKGGFGSQIAFEVQGKNGRSERIGTLAAVRAGTGASSALVLEGRVGTRGGPKLLTREIHGLVRGLENNVGRALFAVELPDNTTSGGSVLYTIEVEGADQLQVLTGTLHWAAAHRAGRYLTRTSVSDAVSVASTGSLSSDWKLVSGDDEVTLEVKPRVTGFEPAKIRLTCSVVNSGSQEVRFGSALR